MPTFATGLANDHLTTHEICKRCVGGLNEINAFLTDGEVNALAGATAFTDLKAKILEKASPDVRHHDDYQIAIQVNKGLQASFDAGIIDAAAVAGCATKTALKTLFVTADPLGIVTVSTTCGDVWIA